MRILIGNDDGIQAPGIQILEQAARQFTDDVWVVAPDREQSGAGHSLTLNEPIRVKEIADRKFSIKGTPTDCMMLAINNLLLDKKPDLVLSGVNCGGNIAEDITYSGTVAVAMEATLLGVKSIALSQVICPDHPVKWETAAHYLGEIIQHGIDVSLPAGVFLNVNFPHLTPSSIKGIKVVRQGQRRPSLDKFVVRVDPRGIPYYWVNGLDYAQSGPEGTDLKAVAEGWISVTPLASDFTHQATLKNLEKVFSTGDQTWQRVSA